MAERPDLEGLREARFGPQGFMYADRSPVILAVLDYAISLERAAAEREQHIVNLQIEAGVEGGRAACFQRGLAQSETIRLENETKLHVRLAQAEQKAERYLQRAHLMMQPCKCDPLWSGEELCNGGCDLTARLAQAERERNEALQRGADMLTAEIARSASLARELRAALDKYGGHLDDCAAYAGQWCTCGWNAAAIAAPAHAEGEE